MCGLISKLFILDKKEMNRRITFNKNIFIIMMNDDEDKQRFRD